MSDNPTYYQTHKEVLDKYTTKYYKEHNVSISCNICNCSVLKYYMSEHKQSQKHIKNVGKILSDNDTIKQVQVLRQTLEKMKAIIIQQRAELRQNIMPPIYTESI